jgi:hypothetical protein
MAGVVKLDWQGPAVLRLLNGAARAGMERRASVIAGRLRSELHRDTGEMAESSFAEVRQEGSRLVLSAGSDAEHTAYHELGTSRYPAHPQIRTICDQEFPRVLGDIAAEVGGRAGGAVRRAFGRGR